VVSAVAVAKRGVTRVRATEFTTNTHGNKVPNWATATEAQMGPCLLAPTQSTELTDQRASVSNVFTLYAPVGADLTARDRVRIDGDLFEVDGEPSRWPLGVTASLIRWEG